MSKIYIKNYKGLNWYIAKNGIPYICSLCFGHDEKRNEAGVKKMRNLTKEIEKMTGKKASHGLCLECEKKETKRINNLKK